MNEVKYFWFTNVKYNNGTDIVYGIVKRQTLKDACNGKAHTLYWFHGIETPLYELEFREKYVLLDEIKT